MKKSFITLKSAKLFLGIKKGTISEWSAIFGDREAKRKGKREKKGDGKGERCKREKRKW